MIDKPIEHNFIYSPKDYIHNLMFLFLNIENVEFQITTINKSFYISAIDNNPLLKEEDRLIFMSVLTGQINHVMLDVHNILGLGVINYG